MRKEKPILNDNLFPVDDLFVAVLNLVDTNINGLKEELNIAISQYIENGDMKKATLENEDDVTTILRRFLSDLDFRFDFELQTKAPEKNEKTDIGVLRRYSKKRHIPICIIEAKRLPTPIYFGSQETEYVCYKSARKQGGIERFKTEKHGAKLPFSLMVGYIQQENAEHWHTKVNDWITEQILKSSNESISWNDNDLLIKDETFSSDNCITKYTSEHIKLKSDSEKIKLTHYWIDLIS
jgi:hypothetical protein